MSFQGFRSLAGQLVLCGPLMLACMFSGAGEAPAGSGEIKAGDRVVTIRESPLMLGKERLGTVQSGAELKALEVEGAWVGVGVVRDGQEATGWIPRRDLRPAPKQSSPALVPKVPAEASPKGKPVPPSEGGAASETPTPKREERDSSPSLDVVSRNPRAYIGKRVTWTGKMIELDAAGRAKFFEWPTTDFDPRRPESSRPFVVDYAGSHAAKIPTSDGAVKVTGVVLGKTSVNVMTVTPDGVLRRKTIEAPLLKAVDAAPAKLRGRGE